VIDTSKVEAWVDAYERVWRTAGTERVGELFTTDASYQMQPFLEPHRGIDAIRKLWDADRRGPEEDFEMQRSVVALDGQRAVVRVGVRSAVTFAICGCSTSPLMGSARRSTSDP
jgi:hypothetical protein